MTDSLLLLACALAGNPRRLAAAKRGEVPALFCAMPAQQHTDDDAPAVAAVANARAQRKQPPPQQEEDTHVAIEVCGPGQFKLGTSLVSLRFRYRAEMPGWHRSVAEPRLASVLAQVRTVVLAVTDRLPCQQETLNARARWCVRSCGSWCGRLA